VILDFHTHSFFSDGVLLPSELIRRAYVAGYAAIAVTDHVGSGNVEEVVDALHRECEMAREHWPIVALPGVEITHVPAGAIAGVARRARAAGAAVVVVHGETVTEPVEPGTNAAAVACDDVDILAHPGLISDEDANAAARRGCFIELSGRKGHAYANGHVARVAVATGARVLVNSDSHEPADLLTASLIDVILRGAAVPTHLHDEVTSVNAREMLERAVARLG
jgi:histidinol phosphatase-like PHP family hydrolase